MQNESKNYVSIELPEEVNNYKYKMKLINPSQ